MHACIHLPWRSCPYVLTPWAMPCVLSSQAFGYGIQIGIGGGVGVFSGKPLDPWVPYVHLLFSHSRTTGVLCLTGCTITTNVPLFAFAGAGGQQFMGGGVLVNTGVESIGAFGVGKTEHQTLATPTA